MSFSIADNMDALAGSRALGNAPPKLMSALTTGLKIKAAKPADVPASSIVSGTDSGLKVNTAGASPANPLAGASGSSAPPAANAAAVSAAQSGGAAAAEAHASPQGNAPGNMTAGEGSFNVGADSGASMQFSRMQALQQAGSKALAQANQAPQALMKLSK